LPFGRSIGPFDESRAAGGEKQARSTAFDPCLQERSAYRPGGFPFI
jgi:hypothetical protein